MYTKKIEYVLQKYYNALKAINELNAIDKKIDNIANLDTFFSEYRNITFVYQKQLSEEKEFYEKLVNKYLNDNLSKWLVSNRNSVIHEKSIDINKTLIITLYSITRVDTFESSYKIDQTINIEGLIDLLSQRFSDLKVNEINFSIKLLISNNNKEYFDLNEKILLSLKNMHGFIHETIDELCANDKDDLDIIKNIDELYLSISSKGINDTYNCCFENGNITIDNFNTFGMFAKNGMISLENTRNKIPSRLLKLGSFLRIFKYVTGVHIQTYIKQNYNLLPVVFIGFKDNTYKMFFVPGQTKAAKYNKLLLINNIIEKEKACFFIYYDLAVANSISNIETSYSERLKNGIEHFFGMFINNHGDTYFYIKSKDELYTINDYNEKDIILSQPSNIIYEKIRETIINNN